MSRPKKEIRISRDELRELGARPEVGFQFWTDQLDLHAGEYEVTTVQDGFVLVVRVSGPSSAPRRPGS